MSAGMAALAAREVRLKSGVRREVRRQEGVTRRVRITRHSRRSEPAKDMYSRLELWLTEGLSYIIGL